jgi:DNA-binding transcriptional LysR family regulator
LNTLFFKYALEIERCGSLTKASQKLYMAQPNLSKCMKELEHTLGFNVFQRTSTGMYPTEKGKTFLTYARNIIEQLSEMEQLSKQADNNASNFRVSIPRGSYIANGFSEFISEISGGDGFQMTIRETNSMQTMQDVADGKFNLGVIRYQSNYENYFMDYLASKKLKHEQIWQFEYLIAMSMEHPLANEETITIEQLENFIEISHGDIEIPYLSKELNGQQSKLNQKKKIYVYDRGSQYDLLTTVPQTYMWVSPLPERYLKLYSLTQRACQVDNNQYKDVLIYRNDYQFSQMDEIFQRKLYESKIGVSTRKYQ